MTDTLFILLVMTVVSMLARDVRLSDQVLSVVTSLITSATACMVVVVVGMVSCQLVYLSIFTISVVRTSSELLRASVMQMRLVGSRSEIS